MASLFVDPPKLPAILTMDTGQASGWVESTGKADGFTGVFLSPVPVKLGRCLMRLYGSDYRAVAYAADYDDQTRMVTVRAETTEALP